VDPAALLPRVAGHDEQDDIEVEGPAGFGGGDDVTDVGRVEGATQHPDAITHRGESRSASAPFTVA